MNFYLTTPNRCTAAAHWLCWLDTDYNGNFPCESVYSLMSPCVDAAHRMGLGYLPFRSPLLRECARVARKLQSS